MRSYLNRILSKRLKVLVVFVLFLANAHMSVHAQVLEPRAFTNAPVGLNFLLTGYQYSSGALVFDSSLPITDANANVHLGFVGYVRTLDIASKSAKVGIILPYASLFADGYIDGEYSTRDVSGIGDPALFFNINFYGAPALSVKEYKAYRQDTIIGFSFKATAPYGAYEPDKIINIGTNRWSFKPEFGISQTLGRWRIEGALAAIIFTDNENFDNGSTRKQNNIYSAQGHIVYTFKNRIWAAISATYFEGGQTTIAGVINNDLLQNWRTGFTIALPINRNNSIKLFGNSGVSTRTGSSFDALGIAWQYLWGEGA